MNRSVPTVPCLTLAMLVVLGGPCNTRAGASGDACSLLSARQVSAVLGVPVSDGEHIVPDLMTSCGWAGPGGPSIGSKKIVLSLMTARSFVSGKTPVKGVTMTVADGVGDEAYYISMPDRKSVV